MAAEQQRLELGRAKLRSLIPPTALAQIFEERIDETDDGWGYVHKDKLSYIKLQFTSDDQYLEMRIFNQRDHRQTIVIGQSIITQPL